MIVSDTLQLAQQLIRIPSITPQDLGCQQLLSARLLTQGFSATNLSSGSVSNTWLQRAGGLAGPTLLFAGHTDVVPSGALTEWQYSPFDGEVIEGVLYGRGAADMKGALAAMITAVERFLVKHQSYQGSIAFALTSDEEGAAVEGTQRIVSHLLTHQIPVDYCVIGEASSAKVLGDQVRVGRRGSLHGEIVFCGALQHVAYAKSEDNLLHQVCNALNLWCQQDFGEAVSCHLYSLTAGKEAVVNMTPDTVTAQFNLRFAADTTVRSLQAQVEDFFLRSGLAHTIVWKLSSLPFLSKSGKLRQTVADVLQAHTGKAPLFSTGGGTSDGRFLIQTGAEIIELGCLHESIHQHNEHVQVADLERLSQFYEAVLYKLLV